MSKALAYGISFISSCTATAILASPMPYVVQNQAELGQVLQRYAIDRQDLALNYRSYNNPVLMGLMGVGALVSFGLCFRELSDKPLIESAVQSVQPTSQPQPQPIAITNINKVDVRSPRNPSKSVEESYTPDRIRNSDTFAWLKKIYGSNCLMFFGGQGSGKTSFVEWYAKRKSEMGQEVLVLDPHKKYGAWEGLNVVGGGRDYDAVNDELKRIEGIISSRYEDYSDLPDFNPRPITVICEEFTKWKDKCENADSFFVTALTDVRKVKIQVVFVSHVKTMSGLTGQKGLSDTFKTGVDMLELVSKPTECADGMERPRPSGKGYLKLTGEAKPFLVDIPSYDSQKAVGTDSDEDGNEKSIAEELNELFPDLVQDEVPNNKVVHLRKAS